MKKILLSTLIAGLWSGCTMDADDPCYPGTNGDAMKINISATIAKISPPSKTTITGSTAAWADNDAIGLFCPQAVGTVTANNQFTVTNTTTTPTWSTSNNMYWKDGSTAHKFLGYAPYASGNDNYATVKLPALNSQNGTIAPASDFLLSNNQWTTGVTRSASPVALTFTHGLSLIEFDISIGNGIVSGATLTSFVLASPTAGDKVYTSDATSSTIDISTGAITTGTVTNTTTVTPAAPIALSATPKPVYVLVLPTTGYTSAPNLTITLSEGGTSVTVPTASLTTKIFTAGSKYTYSVAISRTAITISNPTITDWAAGGTGSLNPGI